MRDTIDAIFIVIWVFILAFAAVMAGYSMAPDVPSMPKCHEDEYLYPVDAEGRPQYEGPGEADPDEYGCFPFDGPPRTPGTVLG